MWRNGVVAPSSVRPPTGAIDQTPNSQPNDVAKRWFYPDGPTGEILPVVSMIGLTLLFFWKIAFTGLVLAGYDAQTYFYPYRLEAADALHHGRIPLWDPYLFLGAPFMANIQTAVFYPLNVVFYLMPVWYAMNASVLVHIALAGLLMYAFLRSSLGLDRTASLIGGMTFMFSGFMGAQVGHINQINVAVWLPGLLLALDKAMTRGSRRWMAVGAVIVTVQMLAGHSQESYLILVTSGLFTVFRMCAPYPDGASDRTYRWKQRLWAPATLLLVVGLGMAMSLFQLLPTLELAGASIRGGGLSYADAVSFSLRPWELLDDLLPGFTRIPFTEYVGYVGIFALALAGLALAAGRKQSYGMFFAGLIVFGLFFGLGGFNPLWIWAHKLIPGFKLFRVPARWLFVYTFGAAGLTALGADFLGHSTGTKRGWQWIVRHPLTLCAGFLLIVTVVLGIAGHSDASSDAATRARWALLFVVAFELIVVALASGQRKPYQIMFACLIAVELFFASRKLAYNAPLPAEVYSDIRPTEAMLSSDHGLFRVLSVAADNYEPGDKGDLARLFGPDLTPNELDQFIVGTKWKEVLTPNLSMAYHVDGLDGYDGGVLPLRDYVQLKRLFVPPCSGCDNPDAILRNQLHAPPDLAWMSLLNVKYLIADKLHDGWDKSVYYDLSNTVQIDPERPWLHLHGFPEAPASSLGMVSSLNGAATVPDGTPVASVVVSDSSGRSYDFQLLAGSDTAEAAWTSDAAHKMPTPFPDRPQSTGPRDYLSALRLPTDLWVTSIDVKYLLDVGQLNVDSASLVDQALGSSVSVPISDDGSLSTVQSGDTKVYRNNLAAPRAFFTSSVRLASSDDEALSSLQELGAGSLMPGGTVVITYPGETPHASAAYRLLNVLSNWLNGPTLSQPPWLPSAALGTDRLSPQRKVTTARSQPERLELTTSSPKGSYLVVSDQYYPGWRAKIDGRPATLYRADYLLMAVYVPDGQHHVVIQYQSSYLRLGAVASVLAFVATIVLGALAPRSRRPKDSATRR